MAELVQAQATAQPQDQTLQPEKKELIARMGKYVVAHNPHTLMALGLGSCVGVILYDPKIRIGGIAHIMLPDSTKFFDQKDKDKFADIAIPNMIDEMIRYGAKKENISARIAGGAQMFAGMAGTEMDISQRNVDAVKDNLKKENIPLVAEDTGENFGRTVRLDTITGKVEISTKMREKVYYI